MILPAMIVFQRKIQPDPGATPCRRIPQFEPAAVVGENFSDDREAEPRSVGARRHVGFEEPLPVLLGKTVAVVDHVDGDGAPGNRGRHRYLPFEAGFAGVRGNPFGRVFNDVRQGLGQKPPVERHLDRILRKPLLKHNGWMCDPHQEKNLAHTFAKIAAFETGFRHPRERRKFIHHAFDVVDLPDDCIGTLVENVAVLLDQTAIFAFQPFRGQLDRRQRIF